MKSIYKINNKTPEIEIFENSKIFIIDDFYSNPDKVVEKIENNTPKLWKKWQTPSYNGKYFLDKRHDFVDQDFLEVSFFLENLCNQHSAFSNHVITNYTKFLDKEFNDYENNYWIPHKDLGYNGIIYLNNIPEHPGTNLYSNETSDILVENEHYEPWRLKDKWKKIKTLNSKFNRLVLFDGAEFWHGMSIDDDTFFETTRLNQTIFFVS